MAGRIDRKPNDNARRRRQECVRCGTGSNLATIPFRGRVVTLCASCRVSLGVSDQA